MTTEPYFHVSDEITTVFFDLDDTLSDHSGSRDRAVREWVAGFPHWTLTPDDSVQRWKELEVYWFARYVSGELDIRGQRAQRIREFLPWATNWSQAKAIDAFDQLRSLQESHWRAFPDAKDALNRCLRSGRKVGILTNGETDYQVRKMGDIGLSMPQVTMLASGGLPAAKPDIRAFQEACARMATNPGQTLMIGDNPETDIAGGQNAGLRTCQLCRNGEIPVTNSWVRSLDRIVF